MDDNNLERWYQDLLNEHAANTEKLARLEQRLPIVAARGVLGLLGGAAIVSGLFAIGPTQDSFQGPHLSTITILNPSSNIDSQSNPDRTSERNKAEAFGTLTGVALAGLTTCVVARRRQNARTQAAENSGAA